MQHSHRSASRRSDAHSVGEDLMDVKDLKELNAEVKRRIETSIEHVRRELGGLRTGRASVTLLDAVHVEAYDSVLPLNGGETV